MALWSRSSLHIARPLSGVSADAAAAARGTRQAHYHPMSRWHVSVGVPARRPAITSKFTDPVKFMCRENIAGSYGGAAAVRFHVAFRVDSDRAATCVPTRAARKLTANRMATENTQFCAEEWSSREAGFPEMKQQKLMPAARVDWFPYLIIETQKEFFRSTRALQFFESKLNLKLNEDT